MMFEDFGRAWRVACEAWRQERKKTRVRHHRNELEFMPAAVEILETPPSPLGRSVALVIAVFVVGAVVWAWYGRIDTVAVAQGKIIPTGGVKVIQPLEIGVVSKIHVEDGQRVRKGDPLIDLDPTDTGATREQLRRSLATARLDVARQRAFLKNPRQPMKAFRPREDVDATLLAHARSLLEAEAKEFREGLAAIQAEIAQRRAERGTVEARIRRFDNTLPILKKRVDAYGYLVKKEYGRKLTYLELQEQLVTQQRDRSVEVRRLTEIDSAIDVHRRRRSERYAVIERTVRGRLAEVMERVYGLEQELLKADERSRLRVLRAPVTGTVQQLGVRTVGAVATPAQKLMVIVPADSRLEIEAVVLNKDIGFVAEGQSAEIKVESFPFTKYGLIPGRLLHLSADAVADEQFGLVYPARISMERHRILVGDRWVKLGSGMAVTVEVKTGKRRAIEFFMSPFLKYQDEALRER